MQDVRLVRGMGQDLSDHVLWKVRLVGKWREVVISWLGLGGLEARN